MDKTKTTKGRIVEAAWELFHENGYDETTVEDIITASGTSKGTFYHYFASKDTLLSSMSDLFDDYYRELMQRIDPEMNSFDKLITLCYESHKMINDKIQLNILSSLYSSQITARGDKHLLNQNRYYFQMLQQIIDEGQRRGEITNEMPYYEIVKYYAMCERAIIYDYCISNASYDLGEFARQTLPLMLQCLKPKQPK